MSELIQADFYTTVSGEVAAKLQEHEQSIIRIGQQAMIDIGRELLAAKEIVEHGKFTQWIRERLPITDRSAQKAMNAAAFFGDKTELSSVLNDTSMYLISAPGNRHVADVVVGKLQSGEVSATVNEIKTAIAEAKAAKKAQKDAETRLQATEQRLAQVQADASDKAQAINDAESRIAALTRTIHFLQEELRQQPEPRVKEVPQAVTPPAVLKELEEKRIQLAQTEAKFAEMTAYLETLRTELRGTQETRRIEAEGQRIRQQWQSTQSKLLGALREFAVSMPSQSDMNQWETDEWALLAEAQTALKRTQDQLAELHQHTIIDA
jgi:Protein of unknown function (DUF3102)